MRFAFIPSFNGLERRFATLNSSDKVIQADQRNNQRAIWESTYNDLVSQA